MAIVRGILVAFGVTLVTVWLVASGLAPSRTPAAEPAAPVPAAETVPDRPTPVKRLRQRLATMPDARHRDRDPFHFAPRARTPAPAADDIDPPAGDPPPAIAKPRLQLLGIAQDARDGRPVRTAVIGGMNQVFLVSEGDQMALRFLVKRVGADSVDVEDMTDGTIVTLAWR
jgi:hypothetical protein